MRLAILFICVFASLYTHAQLKLLLHESFNDNHLGWYEHSDDQHTIQLTDGHYQLRIHGTSWLSVLQAPLDPKKDFAFEAIFTQVDGKTNNGYGLVWGYDQEARLNNFIISGNGYFKVSSVDEPKTDKGAWIESEAIHPTGKPNKLLLKQEGDRIVYYINDTEVHRSEKFDWYGTSIGLVGYTSMNLFVDDVKVYSDVNINLPDDFARGLIRENLGEAVNTPDNEVTPKISVDGKTLFFTRRNSAENTGGVADDADIWYSTTANGEVWGDGRNIGAPINTAYSNAIVSLSADNNKLLVATADDFEQFVRIIGGWKSEGKIGAHFSNESEFMEASQSADGKAILLSIRYADNIFYSSTKGERDLYVILKEENGSWQKPLNLGSTVNTTGNEISPFLSADGQTLYFASDGHPGYGGLDIFMSKRLDDSWANWTEPVNLGPEINTFNFDAYYTVPASGDVAYLCTSNRGYGRSDIIRIKLPQPVKPDPVVLVKGRVLNAKTKKPVEATIRFENLATQKESGEAVSGITNGMYQIALPYGVNYGVYARAEGYLSVNENIALKDSGEYAEVVRNLYLVPIETGESLRLNNVFFEQGRPLLMAESYPELNRLVLIMNEHPSMVIELSGHTDNQGNPSGLMVLSQDRVAAVKKYLVEHGIAARRIVGKGYGGSRPLVKNDSEESRKMNRRVEFKIIKK
jgi:outer membrane protein OmpA-like peptidoglycan-associated protein